MTNKVNDSPSMSSDAPALPDPNATLLLHSVLSQLQEGVVVLDDKGYLSLINSAAQRMVPLRSGLSTPFLSPQSWGAYQADGKSLFSNEEFPVMHALRGENVGPVEFFARHGPAAEGLWIQATARSLIGPNQSQMGCLVFLRDVTDRKQMEKDLLEVSGAEKKHMGEELHDGVCQILIGIKFMCSVLIGKLSASAAPEAADVAEIQSLVTQALMEADLMAKGMFPAKLEVEGLPSALEDLTIQMARLYRVSCRFLCEGQILIFNRDVALNVYRIAQEALANAVKHGRAGNIVLWLTRSERRFTLLVKDDGRVPSEPSPRRGMGRRIMSARAEEIGATLLFEYSPGGGTLLTCEFSDLPVAPPAAEVGPHEKSEAP